MSGPDPSKTPAFFHGSLREQPNAKFESDLADLAMRFSAQSGGGLSPELSADLALEIVLNEIVEQACLATGATGAAIVLERDGEMICRATTGSTAPELGSRLDISSGLSGECFKTQRTQWCDETKSDQRVDVKASERLGVRSVVVMPLLRNTKIVGVIELFSSQPYAFGVRDERTLEVLADRTVNNLDHAARPLELQKKPAGKPPESQTAEASAAKASAPKSPAEKSSGESAKPVQRQREEEQTKGEVQSKSQAKSYSYEPSAWKEETAETEKRETRSLSHSGDWLLGAAALACAILLGLAVGRHWSVRNTAVYAHPHTKSADIKVDNPATGNSTGSSSDQSSGTAVQAAKPDADHVPPGGLLVLENGKEVFRMPPKESHSAGADQAVGVKRAASLEPDGVMQLSPAAAEGSLLQRVEPDYPEAARQQNIQGIVVLEVHIAADGTVQDVQVVRGPPILAQAGSEAVKQWKFKPRLVNGNPVEMQTTVTLNFRMPK
jgi:TonB family protein